MAAHKLISEPWRSFLEELDQLERHKDATAAINEELIALCPVVYFQFHDASGGDHLLLSSPSAFTLPNRV